MGFWGNLTRKLIVKVVKPELVKLTKDIGEALMKSNAAVNEVRDLKRQLTSLQAIDAGFRESGKVILLTRINGQDRVKIFDTKKDMTLAEYQRLSEQLSFEYGAKPTHVDGPMGTDLYIKN